ncbi:MAG: AIPR family protein [Giesbergeria sp.]
MAPSLAAASKAVSGVQRVARLVRNLRRLSGSQKNFARYATRIGGEWEKSSDGFNEFYFKRAVARGLIFRATERIVSAQPWYNGGYRANIVAYTLAMLGELAKRRKACVDFPGMWNAQGVNTVLESSIAVVAGVVNDDIIRPPVGISNISEWCKREACWTRIQTRIEDVEKLLPPEFHAQLLSIDDQAAEVRSAKHTQKIDNGIEAQRHVLAVPAGGWARLHQALLEKELLTPKEAGVLRIAMQIPAKIPTEKQCAILLDVLGRGRAEGIVVER